MSDDQFVQITKELKNIMQNQPLSQAFLECDVSDNAYFAELHQTICQLSISIDEIKKWLQLMSEGRLEIEPPTGNNLVSGSMKEFHSVIKCIIWKAFQVAQGDYKQRIDHMGSVSECFNLMVQQLSEREVALERNAISLERSLNLVTSIVEMHEDWAIVVDTVKQQVVYANRDIKDCFYGMDVRKNHSENRCPLMGVLINMEQEEQEMQMEYLCAPCGRTILIRSFPVDWNGVDTMVHLLKDITERKIEEKLVYFDELTGIYNRRFCSETLQQMLKDEEEFVVILLDIDDLKFVNDNFGHQEGDKYIISVVEEVKKALEIADIFCRIGGDEFVVILPHKREEDGINQMEKARSVLIQKSQEYRKAFSYGGLYVSPKSQITFDDLMIDVDTKMYQYKKNK